MKLSEKLEARMDELQTALDEQKSRYDEAVEKGAEDKARIEALERQLDEVQAQARQRTQDEEVAKDFSLARLYQAVNSNDWTGAEYERSVINGEEARAMAAAKDSAGGFLVPAKYLGEEFIETLEAALVVRQAGARVMSDLMGSPIEIPKQTGGATGYWTGENAEITASSATFGMVKMEPHGCNVLVKASNRLLKQSSPSVEAVLREDMAYRLAAKIDYAALRGNGANGSPSGIEHVVTATTAAALSEAQLRTLHNHLASNDALRGNLAWVTSPTVWNSITGLTNDQDTYKMVGSLTDGFARRILGYPVYLTTAINADKFTVFGNWADLIIGEWGGIEFFASQSRAMEYNQTWIRATLEVDVAVRHTESFAYEIFS